MILDVTARIIRWIVRYVGGLTIIQLALLSLILFSVSRGLIAVIGKLSAGPLVTIAFLGILVGWLLARTRLNWWQTGGVAVFIGLVYLLLTIGRMSHPILLFLPTLRPLASQVFHCTIWPSLKPILSCPQPDFSPTQAAWKDIIATIVTLGSRLTGWYKGVRSGIKIVDPLVAPLFWGTALWIVVTWATWWVRRRNSVLIGLLPAATLLAYNVYYTNSVSGIIWLVWMGGGMILLQAANSYFRSERKWVSRRMDRVVIEPTLVMAVVLLAGGLMLAGGLLPSLSIKKINNTIQELFHPDQNKNLAESLGLSQTPDAIKKAQSGGGPVELSTVHPVGPGPHLTQDIIMYIHVDNYNPLPPDVARLTNAPQPDVSYYWRAETFDSYNGHVWISNANQTVSLTANTPFHPGLVRLSTNYQEVTQHVKRFLRTGGILFSAGDLFSTDQPSTTEWRASGDLVDAATEAPDYTAVSRIPYVTADELRKAGNIYPDSIRNRYLTLPDELPQRVRDLALDLTSNQLNPYDRAKAIETYLRHFPYSLDVPAPPSTRDVADYFLFDLKKGYCDYFATTMVVLSRAAGLPARLVTGYSSGVYDYPNSQFVVVAANSHSWVEIYFPDIGWVEFEPTTNLPPIARPGEPQVPENALANIPTPAPKSGGLNFHIPWTQIRQPLENTGIILLILLFLYLVLPIETWLLYLRPADKAMEAIFTRLYHRGPKWGIQPDPSRTPHEYASLLVSRLNRFKKNRQLASTASRMANDLDWLVAAYTRLLFSPVPLTSPERRQAIRTWDRVRRGLSRLQHW